MARPPPPPSLPPRGMAAAVLLLLVALTALTSPCAAWHTDNLDVDFLEDVALAPNRTAALELLPLRSLERDYLSILDSLARGDLAAARELAHEWRTRGMPSFASSITTRLAFYDHDRESYGDASAPVVDAKRPLSDELSHLLNGLGYDLLRHSPPSLDMLTHQASDLPSQVDLSAIARDNARRVELHHACDSELRHMLHHGELDTTSIQKLIEHDIDPSRMASWNLNAYPDAVKLVEQWLQPQQQSRTSVYYDTDALAALRHLSLSQLDRLLSDHPTLASQDEFTRAYTARLRWHDDIDIRTNRTAMVEYLGRMVEFFERHPEVSSYRNALFMYLLYVSDQDITPTAKRYFMQFLRQAPAAILGATSNSFQHRHEANRFFAPEAQISSTGIPEADLYAHTTDHHLVNFWIERLVVQENHPAELFACMSNDRERQAFAEVYARLVHYYALPPKSLPMPLPTLSPDHISHMANEVELRFVRMVPRLYVPLDQPVSISMVLKNTPSVLVRGFEIDTLNYFTQHQNKDGFDATIRLDGLLPQFEFEHRFDRVDPVRRVRHTFEFPQLDRRGIYVLDFISNGKNSRVVVHKGHLSVSTRDTHAGVQVLTFDETGAIMPNVSVRFGGRHFRSDSQGIVMVPFSVATNTTLTAKHHQLVVSLEDGFSSRVPFRRSIEQYQLTAAILLDPQSISPLKRAPVLVHPRLTLNGLPAPISLLSNLRLSASLTFMNGRTSVIELDPLDGSSSSSSSSTLNLTHTDPVFSFLVPKEPLTDINLQLKGSVELGSTGDVQHLSYSHPISLGTPDSNAIWDWFLYRNQTDFYAMLIGKSGEFIPREAAEIEFLSHRRHHRAQVATDHHGRIWLGSLHGIESVHISTSTSLAEHQCSRKWLLPAHSHYTSQVESSHTRYIGTDESLHLPYLGSANEISASEFSLTAHPTLESFHSYLSLDGDSSARTIVIRPLPRGTYELYVGSSTDCSRRIYTIHVTEKAHRYNLVVDQLDDESSSSSDVSESFVVSPTQLFHSDPLTPTPRVSTITTNADGSFDIAIMNVTETTRVHLFATLFTSTAELARFQASMQPLPLPPSNRGKPGMTVFLRERLMGTEEMYIIARRNATSTYGNMLSRPSLLMRPWKVSGTDTEIKRARAGETFSTSTLESANFEEAYYSRAGHSQEAASSRGWHSSGSSYGSSGAQSRYDFVRVAPRLIANMIPDPSSGIVRVASGTTRDLSSVTVLVTDANDRFASWSGSLPPATLTVVTIEQLAADFTRNTTFSKPYPPRSRMIELRESKTIRANESLVLEHSSNTLSIVGSTKALYDLYQALPIDATVKSTLSEFEFVTRWHRLDLAAKRDLYQRFGCHELNLFLFVKDHSFFLDTVLPVVRGKLHKDVVDLWLLEGGSSAEQRLRLSDEVPFFAIASNNALEQILWASSLPHGDTRRQALVANMRASARVRTSARGHLDMFVHAARAQPNRNFVTGASVAEGEMLPVGSKSHDDDEWEPLAGYGGRIRSSYTAQPLHRKQARHIERTYQPIDRTKELAESYYYNTKLLHTSEMLVPINDYWADLAHYLLIEHEHIHERSEIAEVLGHFLSPNLHQASESFTAIMLALSFSGFPFESTPAIFDGEGSRITAAPNSPVVIFCIQASEATSEALPEDERQNTGGFGAQESDDTLPRLSVRQTFHLVSRTVASGDPNNGTVKVSLPHDSLSAGEVQVLAGREYEVQVRVVNHEEYEVTAEVMIQVPQGAVALGSPAYASRSYNIVIRPFSSSSLWYRFYFPYTGEFEHYPAHVWRDRHSLALATPVKFIVKHQIERSDQDSWLYIFQYAETERVLEYLSSANLFELVSKYPDAFEYLAWRMHNRNVYERVLSVLRSRLFFVVPLWNYALLHRDAPAIRELLAAPVGQLRNVRNSLMPHYCSPLVSVNCGPTTRELETYQHLEYAPIVNVRAHRVHGEGRKSDNVQLRQQYQRFLALVAHKPTPLPVTDLLAAAYYLIAQDRIYDAVELVDRIEAATVGSSSAIIEQQQLSFDYLRAYIELSLPDGSVPRALALANHQLATNPHMLPEWKQRYEALALEAHSILQQNNLSSSGTGALQQGAEGADSSASSSSACATGAANATTIAQPMAPEAMEPMLEIALADTSNQRGASMLQVKYRNVDQCVVRIYHMDVERLFSMQPFAKSESSHYELIKPNVESTHTLSERASEAVIPLPPSLEQSDYIVEVVALGGTLKKNVIHLAKSLKVEVLESLGHIVVQPSEGAAPDAPRQRAYVKVYAKHHNGETHFFKDGYTTRRGYFDYASVSSNDLERVSRFAILVLDIASKGSLILEAAPPTM